MFVCPQIMTDENDHNTSISEQQRKDYYGATRSALHEMESGIQSVLAFLASQGLSQATLNQLASSLRGDAQQVIAVLRSCQEYMRLLCQQNATIDTLDLFIEAWDAASVYLALRYKQAHSNYMQLRRSHKINMLAGALQKKMELGELCCQAQKEGLLLERYKKQLERREQQQRQLASGGDMPQAVC